MLRRLRNDLKQMSWCVIGLGAVFLAVGAIGWSQGWLNENLGAELIGIGATVIVIDAANRWTNIQQEKKRLIRQMGSTVNPEAMRAVELLRDRGWLQDGSLRDAYLVRANLQEANLSWANLQAASLMLSNLQGAVLSRASLQTAYVSGADLQAADLSGANLQATHLAGADLQGAIFEHHTFGSATFDEQTVLPDGSKATLETDAEAMRRFTDPDHPEFYEVS